MSATTRSCETYDWCEIDHDSPEWANEASDIHEKQVRVSELERVHLHLEDGSPRMEWFVNTSEVWTEPDGTPQSFIELRDAIDQMISVWDQFQQSLTPRLKRHEAVTMELAERDV